MADSSSPQGAVLIRERAVAGGLRIGIVTLNAPKALNALSLDMIRPLDAQLRTWAQDPQIACVMLDGTGEKAFCAGGDVRFLRAASLAHDGPGPNPQAQAFFAEEYRLDHRIHTYPKPVLLWGAGIVMGGGLGLLAGASHRVVTQTSRIAMPEVSIGLYPDVGGSWFLRRMPGRTGLFLALTGATLNAHDALAVGLADFFLQAADREAVLARLDEIDWGTGAPAHHAALSAALGEFAGRAAHALPESNVRLHGDAIEHLTAGDSLASIHARISGYRGDVPWLQAAAAALSRGSPTSAALSWELWQRARHMSLAEVFRLELIVSLACCAHPDFCEGVRALLVDKDQAPRWAPATLAQVTPAWIDEHFRAPWSAWCNEANPLADLGAPNT